jgi:hypothetical protein
MSTSFDSKIGQGLVVGNLDVDAVVAVGVDVAAAGSHTVFVIACVIASVVGIVIVDTYSGSTLVAYCSCTASGGIDLYDQQTASDPGY